MKWSETKKKTLPPCLASFPRATGARDPDTHPFTLPFPSSLLHPPLSPHARRVSREAWCAVMRFTISSTGGSSNYGDGSCDGAAVAALAGMRSGGIAPWDGGSKPISARSGLQGVVSFGAERMWSWNVVRTEAPRPYRLLPSATSPHPSSLTLG